MLAARSIIWNTWEIYFWEIFFFFPAKVQERDFIPVTIDTESIPISCFSLPSLESASEKRLLKTSLAAGGTLFPPMQLHVHYYPILLSSIGHSYFLPISAVAFIVKLVNWI